MVSEIISTGHIIPPDQSQLVNSNLKQENWGKILSRKNLPILSILIAEYSLVTGTSPNIYYILFPGFLSVWFGFFIVARKIILDRQLAIFISGIGSIAPYVPVIYSLNITSLNNALILISIAILIYIVENQKNVNIGAYISLSLILVGLFYWYPPNFALVGILLILCPIALSVLNRNYSNGLFIPISVSGFLFLQIFEIPLTTYLAYIKTGALRLISLKISSPLSGQTGTYPTVFEPSYYSLMALISLLPLGAIGGLIAIKRVLTADGHDATELVAIIWGSSIFGVAFLYLSSGESFLVGRPFQLSVPVIVIGAMFALSKIEDHDIIVIIIVAFLLITVGGAFALQSTDDRAEIQSYESGSNAVGKWGSEHFRGIILSDLMTGAPVAGDGYLLIDHPDEYTDTDMLFYSSSPEFREYVQSRDASGVLLSSSMHRDGLFANQLPHQPTSEYKYQQRVSDSNLVYSNGEYHYLSINRSRS
ncbi:hypothetical protein [Haloarcula sp. CGMCC 1.2071]|uniref:hypothetical protein n=1 Tax=Haloarcula sp. CGMCC 1.2071 TaxID=3111454 RepID=UPI00300EAA46